MDTRYCFIVNEKSNSSRSRAYFDKHKDELLKNFPGSSIIYVKNPAQISEIVREASQNHDVLVACGGDGTVQTVGKQAIEANKILGIIPLGTGNDFVKNIDLSPKKPIQYYIDTLKSNNVLEADVTMLNDTIFLNTVGMGFDGLTNMYARELTKIKGKLRYAFAGAKSFLFAKRFEATIKFPGQSITDTFWLIAFTNGRVEGGIFKLSPNSLIYDGKVEMVLFRGYNKLKLIYAFVRLLLNMDLKDNFRQIITVEKADIDLSPKQFIHYDGESMPQVETAKFRLKNKKLKVLTPKPVR